MGIFDFIFGSSGRNHQVVDGNDKDNLKIKGNENGKIANINDVANNESLNGEVRKSRKPFLISTRFVPIRLSAMKDGKINLYLKVKNNTNTKQLVSVDALLPKKVLIGFDSICINKYLEERVGEIEAGESKEVSILVWGSNQTKKGIYPMKLTVYSHYLDYKKVLNYTEKMIKIRVV